MRTEDDSPKIDSISLGNTSQELPGRKKSKRVSRLVYFREYLENTMKNPDKANPYRSVGLKGFWREDQAPLKKPVEYYNPNHRQKKLDQKDTKREMKRIKARKEQEAADRQALLADQAKLFALAMQDDGTVPF
jgi:hypothetical protein